MDVQSTTLATNQALDATIRTGTPPDGGSFQQQQQTKPTDVSQARDDDDGQEPIDPKQFRDVVRDRNQKNRKLQELEKWKAERERADEEKKLADMTEAEKAKKLLADAQAELERKNAELRRRDVLIGLSNARVDPAYQDVLAEMYGRKASEMTIEEFVGEQRKLRPALFAGGLSDLPAPDAPAKREPPPPASSGGPQASGASGSQRLIVEQELKQLMARGSKHPTDIARQYALIQKLEGMKG